MKERLRIGLLLAAVVLVNANTLWNAFTMDDDLYIVLNPQVTELSARKLFAPNKFTNVFRPLTLATFQLNWAAHGAHPFGYHLINLLLHGAVTWLLYLLLQAILAPSAQARTVALAAAWLFAVHPIHAEAITSAVGCSELLAAGFLLAAWILHLRDREILALLCFLLALLSKESGVVFLPLVLVGDYARGERKPYLRYARIAGVTLLYLGLLWGVQGGRFGPPGISMLDNPLAKVPAGWRILNALRVAWKYVGLHVYPATLSCDYSFNQIPVYRDWGHTLPAAVAAVAAVGAWIWAVRKRRSGLVLAGGIYLAGFAITANILVPTGTIMGERLAYLPSAGYCLLVALGWNWLKDRHRTLAWGMLAVLVVALAMRTVVRNRDWENNLTLYSAAVQAVPGSAKMHASLGSAYMAHRQFDLAHTELQAALRIYPDYPDALEAYGLLEAKKGNYEVAGWMMEKALYTSGRDNPNYDFMAVNLAALLMQTDHMDGALELLNREIAESPGYARAWSNRAVIRYKRGELASARADAEAALRLEPENTQAQNLMRLLDTAAPIAPAR
ncbi:MAG: tetratricopeptide repeat protein [Acidobacteriia bacterium]|nr:tetratricopeptide repeat protein [Terriglobia bacterium]